MSRDGYLPPGCTQLECDMAQPGYWDEPKENEMPEPTQAQYAMMQIIQVLCGLTPEDRVEALALIGNTYCLGCGYPVPQEGEYCNCKIDEWPPR